MCLTPLKTSSVNGGLYVKKTLYLQVKGAERHEGDWQADCVLLLWLSQLLLIPFDLAAVDSSIDAPVSIDRCPAAYCEVTLLEIPRYRCISYMSCSLLYNCKYESPCRDSIAPTHQLVHMRQISQSCTMTAL